MVCVAGFEPATSDFQGRPSDLTDITHRLTWCGLMESNHLATTLLNNAYRVTAGNREQPANL